MGKFSDNHRGIVDSLRDLAKTERETTPPPDKQAKEAQKERYEREAEKK